MFEIRKFKAAFAFICCAVGMSCHAQTSTVEEQRICAHRVSAYVAGLKTALVAMPDNPQARSELSRINNLSSDNPCDLLKQIPALVESDRALDYATESLKNR